MQQRRHDRSGSLHKRRAAMSLTELMCVIAILSILAALYLPTVARAFARVKHLLGGL